MMLNAVPMTLDTSANNQSVNSGISPCDIFEIALDACAFIPGENRVRLAESVVTLVYASVTKLANANSMLNIEGKFSLHRRVIIAFTCSFTPTFLSLSISVNNAMTSLFPYTISRTKRTYACFARLPDCH